SAFRQMGAEIEEDGSNIRCSAARLRGCELRLPFPSVGATENIMLAACAAEGETVIKGAAREPEISALAEYLRRMGCDIEGEGSDTIVIGGFTPKGQLSYRVISDRIVAATLACAAACTGGDVELRAVEPEHFSTVLYFLKQAGCDIISDKYTVRLRSDGKLRAVGDVCTQPYPGFPTDAQPVLMAALLKAHGRTHITENIFENRYRQVEQLCRLGADISVNGRVADINGVDMLYGSSLEATDLRGGAAMIVAGLSAEGETLIHDEGHIKRGYEDLDQVLCSLGADVKLEKMKGTANGFQYTYEKTQN
ncbi:MAG: UDP-N-acetylglucosamine 1-carboxyvinyltransferase, partial [Peptococcaceae bacterium]|nr:UDP-N-acetylglucosamine 1-carboxyvinyltransferase [Peptococcaceae bacterium]